MGDKVVFVLKIYSGNNKLLKTISGIERENNLI